MKKVSLVKVMVSILAGGILGLIGARYLFVGSWLSLIPWGMVGLLIGYWSHMREWLINGSCYGFVIAFVFMMAGYAGNASLISRIPFFAILGLFGGLCGLVLGLMGFEIKQRLTTQGRRGVHKEEEGREQGIEEGSDEKGRGQ
jgi:hypothetical protein